MEMKFSKQLREKLPKSYYNSDFVDILAWMRAWTLEALDKYDTSREVKFSTFLFGHLKIRCYQEFNWAWQRKQHPDGCWIYTISALSSKEDNDLPFDPEDYRQKEGMSLEEFREELTEKSREILDFMLSHNTPLLIEAFTSNNPIQKVSNVLGLPWDDVENFVTEVREKVEDFEGVHV